MLLTYAYLFQITDRPHYAELSVILASAVGGFFVLNFPKGLIFLGDTGSYFLGYAVGVLSIILAGAKNTLVSPWVPMVVMFYPVWETIFSAFRRLKEGRSPFYPDKEHLHFLLFKFFGNSHLKTTACFLAAQVVISAVAILFYDDTPILIAFFLLLAFLYTYLYRKLRSIVSF
jgi:UDP-N-acetylmuramyl pentapeptide phosphotransferase/UDP-N-acetylglucosamine-1-phosphate transferase